TVEDVIAEWGVSRRVVYKYLRQAREAGELPRTQRKPRRKSRLDPFRQAIAHALQQYPRITTQELKTLLNLPVPLCTISRTLRRWNLATHRSRRPNGPLSE